MADREVIRTRVGIVGAGPAGLMFSHLLARPGSTTWWSRSATREIRPPSCRNPRTGQRSTAGRLRGSPTGCSRGYKHEGIDLRFGGETHRIDFMDLVGASVWLYPQTEVFVDLAPARERDAATSASGSRHASRT